MKRPAVLFALGLACVLALGPAPRRSDGPLSLVRIAKDKTSTIPVLVRLGIDVRQELRTCLLALAERADLDLLRRSGVRYAVLNRDAGRREFLVVGTPGPGDLESLRAAGRAVAVEPDTAGFWTDAGTPAESVPAGLPRKALAPRSVLPYIRQRPAAMSPGMAAAVQDPLVEMIVGLVTSPDLTADVQALQDFQTRYASTTVTPPGNSSSALSRPWTSTRSASNPSPIRAAVHRATSSPRRGAKPIRTTSSSSPPTMTRSRRRRRERRWRRARMTTPAGRPPSSKRPGRSRPTPSTSRSGSSPSRPRSGGCGAAAPTPSRPDRPASASWASSTWI